MLIFEQTYRTMYKTKCTTEFSVLMFSTYRTTYKIKCCG